MKVWSGPGSLVDHHFVHVLHGTEVSKAAGRRQFAQHLHQDSTIDSRMAFDIQLFYFPHEVTAEMGGTRFVPGSHLRIVSESAIARYQNVLGQNHIVCPAGTIFFMHHGIWHGGRELPQPNAVSLQIETQSYGASAQLWDTHDMDLEETKKRPSSRQESTRPKHR